MGMGSDAILAYGYDLGQVGDWHVEESVDGRWPIEDHGVTDFEVPEMIRDALKGWTSDVELVEYGHHEEPGYILAAFHQEAHLGATEEVATPLQHTVKRKRQQWDQQLTGALTVLGVTPTKPRGFLLASYRG